MIGVRIYILNNEEKRKMKNFPKCLNFIPIYRLKKALSDKSTANGYSRTFETHAGLTKLIRLI